MGGILRRQLQRCHDDLLHLLTVFVEQPTSPATTVLSRPSPQPSTIRDRSANACEDFARPDQRSNCSRSSPPILCL